MDISTDLPRIPVSFGHLFDIYPAFDFLQIIDIFVKHQAIVFSVNRQYALRPPDIGVVLFLAEVATALYFTRKG